MWSKRGGRRNNTVSIPYDDTPFLSVQNLIQAEGISGVVCVKADGIQRLKSVVQARGCLSGPGHSNPLAKRTKGLFTPPSVALWIKIGNREIECLQNKQFQNPIKPAFALCQSSPQLSLRVLSHTPMNTTAFVTVQIESPRHILVSTGLGSFLVPEAFLEVVLSPQKQRPSRSGPVAFRPAPIPAAAAASAVSTSTPSPPSPPPSTPNAPA